ncbi:MAG: hypothetical protein ACP5JP_06040 [bacterium]
MKNNVYKMWLLIGAIFVIAGVIIFRSTLNDILAFLMGAGIVGINVLLLGRGISAIIGASKRKTAYVLLLILKYAFLLTTLYVTIVIIKLNPIPFISGLTTLPASVIILTIFLMLRRHDNA